MTKRKTDTSSAAFNGIIKKSERLRAVVYRTLYDHPQGLTVDETCSAARYPRYSLQPRFTELRDKNLIEDTGLRRRNNSGAKAIVWRLSMYAQGAKQPEDGGTKIVISDGLIGWHVWEQTAEGDMRHAMFFDNRRWAGDYAFGLHIGSSYRHPIVDQSTDYPITRFQEEVE